MKTFNIDTRSIQEIITSTRGTGTEKETTLPQLYIKAIEKIYQNKNIFITDSGVKLLSWRQTPTLKNNVM